MSSLSSTLENILQRYQKNTPPELCELLETTKKNVRKMIDKEKEIENLQLFDHLVPPSSEKSEKVEKEERKVEAEIVVEVQSTVIEETFSNDIPICGLFPITEDEWKLIPSTTKGRLTLDLVNGFIKIIDELLAKKSDYESRYFKLNRADKDKVLQWREYETKDLVGRKWIFQDDVTEKLPQQDKYPFLKYGMNCLRHCKKIEQTRRKGKVIIIAQHYD
uniref:SKA complex subunit 1 n=1 Tax=Strongyloides papillosus TaxID=174720 RepID=A0A0N5B9I8_STREA